MVNETRDKDTDRLMGVLGSSFGSLNCGSLSANEDIDQLLSALEVSTNNQCFLESIDDDILKNLLGVKEQTGNQQHVSICSHELKIYELDGQNSLPSIGGMEPYGLEEIPSNPFLLDQSANNSFTFEKNPTTFDESIHHKESTYRGESMDLNSVEMPSIDYLQQYIENQILVGNKRCRAPRRGSLPSMHLHYEDPFEPTPILETHIMFKKQHSDLEPPAKLAAIPVEDVSQTETPAYRQRAQRRGSLPTMHLNYDSLSNGDSHGTDMVNDKSNSEVCILSNKETDQFVAAPAFRQVPRRGSTGSFYANSTSTFQNSTSGMMSNIGIDTVPIPETLNPEQVMKRLQILMEESRATQQKLQLWDKANGLPKSHSQTMVNTSRSRKQLLDGVILPKWDGTPLISPDLALGKPKPRNKTGKKEENEKMKRRMSAPTSSSCP
jgi:hypothetical protein